MSASPSGQPSFYSPALDGLRFLAAFAVFVHHAPPLPVLWRVSSYGLIGVDLFLCISAFLLTRLLSLEFQRTGTLQIKYFFIRRMLRIWPLYFSYATFVCALGFFWYGQEAVTALSWWLSHLTFTNNVMTAANGFSSIPYSTHLWTISLEEQAYLLIPFLLLAFFLSRSTKAHLKVFALVSLGVLLLARLGLSLYGVSFPFIYVLPLRADALIIGAVAAILTQDAQLNRPVVSMVLGVLIMASATLFPHIYQNSLYQIFGYTIVAIGCVLVVVSSQAQVFQKSILASAPLRYLGKISYGIYVYHLICIKMAQTLLGYFGVTFELWQFLTGLVLTLLISSASYALLEKPFLRLKTRFATVSSRPI